MQYNHGTKELTYLVKTDIARVEGTCSVKNGVKLDISIIFLPIQIFIHIHTTT